MKRHPKIYQEEVKQRHISHWDWDYMTALEIDSVIGRTPALHAAAVVQALGACKHVLCEKPMALSVEDCDRMQEAAKAQDRILLIGHVLPFYPEYDWA